MKINLDFAQLDETQLKKIKEAEQKIGATIIAYEKQVKPAQLTEEQLKQIHSLEAELGVILIAFEA